MNHILAKLSVILLFTSLSELAAGKIPFAMKSGKWQIQTIIIKETPFSSKVETTDEQVRCIEKEGKAFFQGAQDIFENMIATEVVESEKLCKIKHTHTDMQMKSTATCTIPTLNDYTGYLLINQFNNGYQYKVSIQSIHPNGTMTKMKSTLYYLSPCSQN